MRFDFDRARNPFLVPTDGRIGVRDAALHYHDGVLRCFFTASFWNGETFYSRIECVQTEDLVSWTPPVTVVSDPPVFWSVGNVLRVGNDWIMCIQDYPMRFGETYAGEDCRLWLVSSPDLTHWRKPVAMNPQGAQVQWTASRRQIDPFLVRHEDEYWCFYKCAGCLSALISRDLKTWREANPSRPLLSRADTPDNVNVENPCIVQDGDEYVLFFAACRSPRAVGVARSADLLHWRDVKYLEFPAAAWIPNGTNAAMVIDLRAQYGRWLMVFHADWNLMSHSGRLGLAWSEDLTHWTYAGERT